MIISVMWVLSKGTFSYILSKCLHSITYKYFSVYFMMSMFDIYV